MVSTEKRGWVGHIAGVETLEKKNFLPLTGIEP
jgi:hypothetical protein